MWSLIAPISSLLGGVALLLLGNGLLNTLLTLRGVAEGYSTSMLGLIMSGYFVGFLLGTWLAIPLVRRVGHIRAFAFCAALAAITALLHVLIVDPWVWLGLRVLYGLALVSLYMVIESWLNAQVPNDKRGQVFAVYMAVNLGALAAAQQLLNLAAPTDFVLFVLAAMLISAALMPITLTRQMQPSVPDTLHTNLRQIVGIAPLAIAAAGLALAIRELALPFVLLAALFAVMERRWRELGGWLALVAAFGIGLALHAHAVAAHVLPGDLPSQGWEGLRGPGAPLRDIGDVTLLTVFPRPLVYVLALLPLFGWLAAPARTARFAVPLFAGYMALQALFAREQNFYWAIMILPAYLAGYAFLPRLVRDLAHALLARRIPAL